MSPLAQVVDVDALLEVIGYSLAAGIGVAAAFSVAILGATRFTELRGDDRPAAAVGFGVMAVIAGAVCVAAIVFGIIVMTTKA